jgi:hypothetical protein
MKFLLDAWYVLPVDHPLLSSAWTIETFQASVGLYVLVFLLKLPLLILDGGIGVLLYHVTIQTGLGVGRAKYAFLFWFLNPYVLFMNELWGSIDILPTFLLVLAFAWLVVYQKKLRGSVALACATALKLFPILLLPAFVLGEKSNRLRLLVAVAGLMGLIGYVIWLSYAGFDAWTQLGQYNFFTQMYDQFSVEAYGGQVIGLATVGLVFLYTLIASAQLTHGVSSAPLLAFLVFFAFANWFPPYFIWVMPFLVMDVAKYGRHLLYVAVIFTAAFLMAIFGFAQYFTANGNGFFFFPANNIALRHAAISYLWVANQAVIVTLAKPVLQAIFSASCLWLAFVIIENNLRGRDSLAKMH